MRAGRAAARPSQPVIAADSSARSTLRTSSLIGPTAAGRDRQAAIADAQQGQRLKPPTAHLAAHADLDTAAHAVLHHPAQEPQN